MCVPCAVAVHSKNVVAGAEFRGRALLEWTVISDDAASLKSLLQELRSRDCRAEARELALSEGKSMLTGRQREVRSAAVDMGFFDSPKRAGLQELAHKFKISKVSVRELIRKAENRVLRFRL